MNLDQPIRIPMADVMGRIHLNVTLTGVTIYRLRLWIGLHLLRLAARVMGVGMHLDMVEQSAGQDRPA
jgi:hypothetical protein